MKARSLQDKVIADLEKRKELGISKYGTLLFSDNGRDMLLDLYEELLDACCYVAGVIEERDRPVSPVSKGAQQMEGQVSIYEI